MGDLSVGYQRIDQWEADLRERVARATELATRMAALNGSAKDGDGLVEVMVDSTGALPTCG